jgi:hypothetical protein
MRPRMKKPPGVEHGVVLAILSVIPATLLGLILWRLW